MLQYITNTKCPLSVVDQVKAVLEGGCKWIQIRMKEASDDEIKKVVEEIKPLCAEKDAFIILNDRVALAKEIEVSGVHLGKTDMLPSKARIELSPAAVIGVTANTFDDILGVRALDIDYLGLGPFAFTETKKNLAPRLGIEGITRLCSEMEENDIKIAKVAVGGIKLDDVEPLMRAGVNGVAVSGAIAFAEDPAEETRRFLEKLTPFEPKASDALND